MTVKEAAKKVLEASNEPLNVQQITERILEQGLWETEGKTPDQTVAAVLYMDIRKHGEHSVGLFGSFYSGFYSWHRSWCHC